MILLLRSCFPARSHAEMMIKARKLQVIHSEQTNTWFFAMYKIVHQAEVDNSYLEVLGKLWECRQGLKIALTTYHGYHVKQS